MKFNGPLDPESVRRVETCNDALSNPGRLEILKRTQLMGSDRDESFDRLAELAAEIIGVPLTIISLVSDTKQFFKAAYGLPAPYDTLREIPIDESICRYTLNKELLVAHDAREHHFLKNHPTIGPWNVGAFIAIPILFSDGVVLGAFCAVDPKPRTWTDHDILVMRELTASVMTEINLRLQIHELKEERDLRERFVATLSHDLRNPLNVAKMGIQLLVDEEDAQEKDAIVTLVSTNIDRADKMIRDLLTASRIKAGDTLALNRELIDISEGLKATVESLQNVHKRRFVFHSDGPMSGLWDYDRIRRIVENLSGNAVKYGASDSAISITVVTKDEGIEISVHNLGPVIAESELSRLFTLFERSKGTKDDGERGWGVGLAIVRALTEEMKGRVTVDSEPVRGTTFKIYLPKTQA